MNEILDDCKLFADKHRGKNKQSGPHWSTIIRFPNLYDEAVRLEKRVETLEAYIDDYATKESKTIQELKNKLNSTYCAYCGAEFALNDEAVRLVSEHIRTCEKHPMRHAEAQIERLTAKNATFKSEIEESNGLLRSAFMIAKRDGNKTNWEAFRGQLDIVLERQHTMMYGDSEQALNEVTKC